MCEVSDPIPTAIFGIFPTCFAILRGFWFLLRCCWYGLIVGFWLMACGVCFGFGFGLAWLVFVLDGDNRG